jgi:anti-sigma-K factor RskA
MPTLPAGKIFEFWVLPAGGASPLPNGVFTAESTGDARYETRIPEDASNYAGFAVSIEDAPGVDVPTNVIAAGTFTTP